MTENIILCYEVLNQAYLFMMHANRFINHVYGGAVNQAIYEWLFFPTFRLSVTAYIFPVDVYSFVVICFRVHSTQLHSSAWFWIGCSALAIVDGAFTKTLLIKMTRKVRK